MPDANEEYFIYQTLLGTYPLEPMRENERETYSQRITAYMTKALREAKEHTSWVDPDPAYEKGVLDFVSAILAPSLSRDFLEDFDRLNRAVVLCGRYNSLSRLVIKLFSPGVPDTYRGSELWDYSLVDPDNRRPVDFAKRAKMLSALKKEYARDAGGLSQRLLAEISSGAIKQFVIWRSLTLRREKALLFQKGRYIALRAAGERKTNLVAFAWQHGYESVIVAAPRLLARITEKGENPPLGVKAWGKTQLVVPRDLQMPSWRNLFTGESLLPYQRGNLRLADIFASFPVAALCTS